MEESNSDGSKKINGATVLLPHIYNDHRGSFAKYFPIGDLGNKNAYSEVRQVNLSTNLISGTIRGLHYQLEPQAEYKLVSCLQGSIFDVILDLRKGSPTFGLWNSFVLRPESGSLLIPPMVAHGFQTLTDNTIIMYLHSSDYFPQLSLGINPLDSKINISWPLDITNISSQDISSPSFADKFLP